jgi:carotenoid cleavage dioxygenase-like enzyme
MPTMRRPHANPYLSGNYAPVHDERNDTDLAIEGRIPECLSGVYMRNGPNPHFEPIEYHYPFEGDGMIHAVTLRNGKASYRNRFVMTGGLKSEIGAGRALYGSMLNAVPVDPALLHPDDPGEPLKNGSFINVVRHGGTYLALDEASPGHEITADLATRGLWTGEGTVPIPVNAHVRPDPLTGNLWTLAYDVEAQPYVTIRLFDPGFHLLRTIPIELPGLPTMMHDFIITERFVVLCHGPVGFDWAAAERGESPLKWTGDRQGARYGIMPKDGEAEDITWFEDEPHFVFHFANAFERNGSILFDYAHHAWLDFGGTTKEAAPPPALLRVAIDMATGKIERHRWSDRVCEFPRFDDRHDGLATQFVYTPTTIGNDGAGFNALMRTDTERGEIVTFAFDGGDSVGEPVFAPRPEGTDEDDGWVMAFVYNAAEDSSALTLWDARGIADGPVCRIRMARRVPEGLHGNWMPDP